MIRYTNLVAAAILTLPLALFASYCGANQWQVAVVCMYVSLCMEIAAWLAQREP